MTATTTPSVPSDPDSRSDPFEPADVIVLAQPTDAATLVPTLEPTSDVDCGDSDDERPVTRLEYAWRVLLVSFLGFVTIGCLRLSVQAPDGAVWLLLAGVCLVAVIVLSVLLVIQTRRARTATRRRRDPLLTRLREALVFGVGSGYGRRVSLSSVIAVAVAVVIVILFNYGLANLAPARIK